MKPPLYITEQATNMSEINSSLKTLESQLKKYPDKINLYASNFIELFLEKLWNFELTSTSRGILQYGEELHNNLISYKILKDDFLTFLMSVTQPDNHLDVDELIFLFEKKLLYLPLSEERGSYSSSNFDNYRVIFHELFICTIAVCLKNRNYYLIEELLFSRYRKKEKYNTRKEPERYTFLYDYHQYLGNYILQKYNKVSGLGYYITTSLSERIPKEMMILADILCYVIGELYKTNGQDTW